MPPTPGCTTVSPPEKAPDQPQEVTLAFEQGTPVAVDGETLSPAALLRRLNRVAGTHGIGSQRSSATLAGGRRAG